MQPKLRQYGLVGLGRCPKQKKSQPPEAVTTAIAVNALSMSRVNFRPRPIGEIPNADEIEKTRVHNTRSMAEGFEPGRDR